jgi:hypothetical protein
VGGGAAGDRFDPRNAGGDSMGLFNLFGGKKKGGAKPSKGKAAAGAHEVLVLPAAGPAQVKLRLKLAQSLRTRRASVAYEAAKELAAIQAKAGRRLGARMWTAEAERIKAGDPALRAAA